jgi:hypothetical protein
VEGEGEGWREMARGFEAIWTCGEPIDQKEHEHTHVDARSEPPCAASHACAADRVAGGDRACEHHGDRCK